ncbi:Uncharacterised protein [uncultured archaeon]|nr:Uncharacterised protein [uncultured archaeon]
MEQVIIGRLCPIIKGQCLETSCAWWIGEKNECHMFGYLQEKTNPKRLY